MKETIPIIIFISSCSFFFKNIIKNAIDLSLEKNLDLEDILQCFCAKENGCSLFLTSDKKFVDCGIKIVNYNEFLGVKNGKKHNTSDG